MGCENEKDLVTMMREVKEENTALLKSKKLENNLARLLIDISPGSKYPFEKQPKTKEIWRWVKGMLKELMKFKPKEDLDVTY